MLLCSHTPAHIEFDPSHLQLLRAAWLQSDSANHEWQSWKQSNTLDTVDSQSYYLLPSLYQNLKRLGLDEPQMGRLRGLYKYSWLTDHNLLRSLKQVLQTLRRAHVTALFTGSQSLVRLGLCDYGTLPDHQIQLAVKSEELTVIDKALKRDGWHPDHPLPPVNLRGIFDALTYSHPTWHTLRVTWRPFPVPASAWAEARLWSDAIPHAIEQLPVLLPSPTDLLLLACLSIKYAPRETSFYSLVHAVVILERARSSINWEALNQHATQLQANSPLHAVLNYLREQLGINVPVQFTEPPAKPRECLCLSQHATLRAKPSSGHSIANLWAHYQSTEETVGQNRDRVGFVRFCVSYCQYAWKRQGWRLPLRVMIKVVRRLLCRHPSYSKR